MYYYIKSYYFKSIKNNENKEKINNLGFSESLNIDSQNFNGIELQVNISGVLEKYGIFSKNNDSNIDMIRYFKYRLFMAKFTTIYKTIDMVGEVKLF